MATPHLLSYFCLLSSSSAIPGLWKYIFTDNWIFFGWGLVGPSGKTVPVGVAEDSTAESPWDLAYYQWAPNSQWYRGSYQYLMLQDLLPLVFLGYVIYLV